MSWYHEAVFYHIYPLGAFGALYCALVLQLPWYLCLLAAMVLGALGRCISATLAGILYWDTAPWASLVYNGAYSYSGWDEGSSSVFGTVSTTGQPSTQRKGTTTGMRPTAP